MFDTTRHFDIQMINDSTSLLREILHDERIPIEVRLDYYDKVLDALSKPKYIVNSNGKHARGMK